jgi:magnesium transporter
MSSHLIDRRGAAGVELDRAEIEERLRRGEFFWLDLQGPAEEDFALLREVFGFHALAIEDSEHFEQRAKLEEYDDFVFLVLYGWAPDEDGLVEVHCFYSERYLITVRRDEAPAFEQLYERFTSRAEEFEEGALLLYRVSDALVDSFFPALADFDDRLDAIEDGIFERPSDAQLQEIFAMKRRLVKVRKAITPQRDLFGRLVSGGVEFPGMTRETERYFRDVYDHLIRLGEMIDTYRDLMTASIDVYLSSGSNRLNMVMKQLTIIATVFLPLTFVTGFFGQNFPWMVDHIGGWPIFLFLGLGLQLATIAALVAMFKRRGWF